MIFGKAFVLNILPAKIQKVKPETKKKGETLSWMNLSMRPFLTKVSNNFELKAVSCGLLTRKLPMKEELRGKLSSQAPLFKWSDGKKPQREVSRFGGGVGQPSMMILRCFGHFLVFHAKTAWAHVGSMKWYLDGLYKRWIAHEKLEFQGFFFSIFHFLRKGRICRISTDPWIQIKLSLQVQKDGYIGKLQTSKRYCI